MGGRNSGYVVLFVVFLFVVFEDWIVLCADGGLVRWVWRGCFIIDPSLLFWMVSLFGCVLYVDW